MTGNRSKFWAWPKILVLLALVLFGFALRLWRLDSQSLWWDEGHSIEMASAPLGEIATLPGMDVHPPGYFYLLHLWMGLAGDSVFSLRYLSLLFSAALLALAFAMATSFLGKRAGFIALTLFCLSPPLVAYAQEVRMYSLQALFASLSVYFLCQSLMRIERQHDKAFAVLAAYALSTAACLYIHYFSIFLLIFENLAWLAWLLYRRRQGRRAIVSRLRLWLGSQCAVVLLFLPQAALALRQTAGYANPNLNPPAPAFFAQRIWQLFTIGQNIPPEQNSFWLLLTAGLFAIALALSVSIWRSGSASQRQAHLFLWGWLLIPTLIYGLVLQVRPSFEPRYLFFLIPALLLIWASGIDTLLARKRIPAMLFSLLLAAPFIAGVGNYFTNEQAFKDDSAGVVAWLGEKTTANDIILVDVPHPFHYYANRLKAPLEYLFVDIHTAAEVLTQKTAGKDRIFWITWYGSDTDPRRVIPFLLEKGGARQGEADFKGYHCAWYSVSPAGYKLAENARPMKDNFSDVLLLDSASIGVTEQRPAAPRFAWATLHYRLLQSTPKDYKVSLRLLNSRGDKIAADDRLLLNDRHFKTSAWDPKDDSLNQAANVYLLPLPEDLAPGDYAVEIVIYNADDWTDFLSLKPDSPSGDTRAVLGSVSIQ
jgi:mannosyltransferase